MSFSTMIHQITLYQTLPHVDEAELDRMMINARVALLKIPGLTAVRTGKNTDAAAPWKFMVTLETDTLDRIPAIERDAIYIKFLAEVISPHVTEQFVARYELEPNRSIRLS